MTSGYAAPQGVRVTTHALDQLRRRFPEFARTTREALSAMVRREVSEAVRDGRVATTQPSWTLVHTFVADPLNKKSNRGKRSKGRDGARYCWDGSQQRAYVYRVEKYDGKRTFVVLTVIGRPR